MSCKNKNCKYYPYKIQQKHSSFHRVLLLLQNRFVMYSTREHYNTAYSECQSPREQERKHAGFFSITPNAKVSCARQNTPDPMGPVQTIRSVLFCSLAGQNFPPAPPCWAPLELEWVLDPFAPFAFAFIPAANSRSLVLIWLSSLEEQSLIAAAY